MGKDPIKTIKEYKKKGYVVAVSIDSTRPIYAVEMRTPLDVQRFTIPIDDIPYKTLHNAVRGL